MKSNFFICFFIIIILIASVLNTLLISNLYFIQSYTYTSLAFCLVFLVIIFKTSDKLIKKENFLLSFNYTDLLLLLIFCIITVSFSFSTKYNKIYDPYLFFILLITSYFYLKNLIKSNKHIANILLVIVLFGLFEASYALLQLAGLLPNIFNYKMGGTFGNPGDLANLLTISYSISLGLSIFEPKKTRKKLLIITSSILLIVIILSFSRTAWITTFIVSCILFFKKIKFLLQNRKPIRIASLLAIPVIIIAFYQLYNVKQASADGRLFIWKLSSEVIKEELLTGHGYGSFLTEIRTKQISYFKDHPLDLDNAMISGEPMFAFNDYLQIAIEFGLITLILFVIFLVSVFIYNSDNRYFSFTRIAIIAVMICMLFSYPLQNLSILFIFVILVTIISSLNIKSIYTLKLNKYHLSCILIIALTFFVWAGINSYNDVKYGLRWKTAFSKRNTNIESCRTEYEYLFDNLQHNTSFLMNYGSILFLSKDYNKCINHFEKTNYLYLGIEPLLMLGDAYEKTNNYAKAEENYIRASLLVPHRFIPKHKLYILYKRNHQNEKQTKIAREIQTMKIKVFSEEVKQIKTEINEFLSSNRK